MTLVYIALVAVFGFLCYYVGKRLSDAENDKKRLDDIHDTLAIRHNANIDGLRKKYKRDSV